MQLTISHQIAATLAREGMERAQAGAEAAAPDWGALALAWIERYARSHERFAGWMLVKAASLDPDFPRPANERAWGGPIKRAAKAGVIERVGMTKDPYRHGNPIPLWRSRIYKEAA